MMKSLATSLLVCVGLVTASVAAETATRQAEVTADKALAEQLKENPDDKSLFDKYMIRNLGEVRSLIDTDPDKAEQQLAAMKKLIESLEPTTEGGKQLVSRGLRAVDSYGTQVELGRVTLEEIVGKLTENPDDVTSLSMYQAKLLGKVMPLTRSEPDAAEKLVQEAKALLASIVEASEAEATRRVVERMERSFSSIEQRIESGRKLAALVGADAAPLKVQAWVNGEPLADADLKGKVVLLDFWAVWCGPCIATFPHLRDWHEQYADKGLVIIGLTRYYDYIWDDESGRPKRSGEEVPPDKENKMLERFAEEHNLHHRFAIQGDSSLSDYYAVSGIPHVVVIDRLNKVRMIRVGSGEKNASEISKMLEQLIYDS